MTKGINASNNICTALNYAYGNLLEFVDNYEFTPEQQKYIDNIKLNLEIALPFGKFTTSKLQDFKEREDPTYTNQKDFFEKDKDYISEMKKEIEKLKNNYTNYKPKEIDESKFFKDVNDYRKYELVKNYEESYNLALQLNDTLDDEQKVKFEHVIKRIIHCFFMAYRMCRKIEDYKKRFPYKGDFGLWIKDDKMRSIKHHALRFRRINEERFERKKENL